MVKVTSKSVKVEIEKLPERLQEEWQSVVEYYSEKKDTVVFEEFKKRYDNFKGKTIEELLCMPRVVYREWQKWKYDKCYQTDFKTVLGWKNKVEMEKSLTEVLEEFKKFWQYDSKESKMMFKEMELLSDGMIQEWRLKYSFLYPHVYERYDCDYHLKSKAQLWEEFKEIWEIDVSDYNEDKYKEMTKYIREIECDYPSNFYEYRKNANYHSFDSYSILEQFEICEDWHRRKLRN